MAMMPNEADPLGDARDALFDAARKGNRLAKSVEQLEARYAKAENPNPGYFYVPTDLHNTGGRTLDPAWTDHAPAHERRPRREAIDTTLALRAAVDSAMGAVSGIAAYMDSEAQSVDQRWTTRTIGYLRKLRGAILWGHGAEDFPSALPMIRAGVPDALREQAGHVMDRMEEVKSAIVAGTKPRTPTVSVSPDLLDRLQRGVAAVDPGAIDRAVERAAERVARVFGAGDNAGTGGAETDWKDVQGRLLAKRDRNERYTSLRKLCAELKCSDATIRKAIGESETLKGWQAREVGVKAAPKATDLGAVVKDNTRQATEPAPDNVLPDDDVDATMARLIDQARPDERAKLNALDDAGRRALVATYQSQNLDDEPSPLEPDKPGERPRKVKHHKRA